MLWQHDDDLLPDNATLQIIDVVYFVEYDKLYISDKIRSPIQHTPENLGGHDETASFGSDLYISSKNATSSNVWRKSRNFWLLKALIGDV